MLHVWLAPHWDEKSMKYLVSFWIDRCMHLLPKFVRYNCTHCTYFNEDPAKGLFKSSLNYMVKKAMQKYSLPKFCMVGKWKSLGKSSALSSWPGMSTCMKIARFLIDSNVSWSIRFSQTPWFVPTSWTVRKTHLLSFSRWTSSISPYKVNKKQSKN